MGRSGVRSAVGGTTLLLIFTLSLLGCGGGSSSKAPEVPSFVTLAPATSSIDLGATQQFALTALGGSKKPVAIVTVTYSSSDPRVVSVSPAGLACGGTWDAVFVVCTPGHVGQAKVAVTVNGATSSAVTVFVHQHVDSITVSPPAAAPPTAGCISQGGTATFSAAAISGSGGLDITSTVGNFTWSVVDSAVASASTTAAGLLPNQALVTAKQPGQTTLFASVSGTNSVAVPFETCRVESITLSSGALNPFTLAAGTHAGVTATAVDSNHVVLPSVTLSWNSSQPAIAVASAGTVTAAVKGNSGITASCTPPGCNTNLQPTYPDNVLDLTVTGTATAFTAYVASTKCTTAAGCSLVPIANGKAGTAVKLPLVPNSLLFNPLGTKAYLGSSGGLMIFDPAAGSNNLSVSGAASGKVLAVSPDGNNVLVSNTSLGEVFIFHPKDSSVVALNIAGASAAVFTADSLKAFIASENPADPVAPHKLYVYSPLDALLAISQSAAINDVTVLANGAFGFMAGGTASSLTARATCDISQGTTNQVAFLATSPTLIQALPDGTQVLAVDSPNIDVLPITVTAPGCPPAISGALASQPFAQGPFTAQQLIITPDSKYAFVLPDNLGSVLVYNTSPPGSTNNPGPIPLQGAGVIPAAGAVTPDSSTLYVIARDGIVHQINLTKISTPQTADSAQISVSMCSGCMPDLIAVRP